MIYLGFNLIRNYFSVQIKKRISKRVQSSLELN